MVAHVLHIGLIDLLFLGVMFTALVFALLLGFVKVGEGNKFLALALLVTALSVAGFLGWVPLGFAAALGSLIYFFVRGVTGKRSRLGWRDGWHLVPVAACFFSLVAVFVFVGLYLLVNLE